MKSNKTWLKIGIVSLLVSSFAALGGISEQTYKPAKAAEKEIIYFNINSSGAYNQNIIILNVDVDLPHTNVNLPVLYNGNYTNFWFNYSSETNIWLTWSGHCPLGTTQYQHYRIDAGTVYYENSTTKYVLRHDYNLWWTGHSGGGANFDMVKQESVPSFKITGYDGQRIDNGYWHMQFTYEKEANAKSINTWNAAPFYESEANDEFTLYDWNTKDVNGNICHGADTLNTSETSGIWYVRIPHGIFTDAADGQDGKARSFYYPRGTIFGGFVTGYPIYLENDIYFDYNGYSFVPEVYDSLHPMEHHPAKCGHPGNVDYYSCKRHEGEYYKLVDGEYVSISENEIFVDVNHQLGQLIPEVPSTCTTYGTKAHYICELCGCYFVEENGQYVEVEEEDLIIPAHHTYQHVNAREATCTENGMKEHYHCEVCNKYFIFTNGEYVEVDPDDLVIPAHHVVEIIPGKEATCTESGLTEGQRCSKCGEVIVEQQIIEPLGHRYGGWILSDENETLLIYRECDRCHEREEVLVNNENGFSYQVVEKPTSSKTGKGMWHSDIYGDFYVVIPVVETTNKGLSTTILVSIIVGGSIIALSIAAFFILKKKLLKK